MKMHEIIDEAVYRGNVGAMEMFQFYQKATPTQKRHMKALLDNNKNKEVWEYMQDVVGVELHGE